VLGAGNCNDLDLPLLIEHFEELHLVDVDAEALERGIERVPASERGRVTLQALDLAGCIDKVDEWGERFPSPTELAAFVRDVPSRIARDIGRTFDVVLSSCLLSQLCHPFQNALAMSLLDWRRLFNAMTRMHLTTVAILARPGGAGIVACDVLSHGGAEVAKLEKTVPRDRLATALAERIADGTLARDPNPEFLLKLLEQPELGALARDARVSEPWLWDLGVGVQLVYGVWFTRPCPPT
jgi:hypothetical protein